MQQQERENEVLPFLILPSRSLSYAKIMQTSGKKACFQFPERSLSYAKITQASGKKACFQFPECSLSYAKITYPTYIPKNMNQKMNRFHADTLPLTSHHNHESKTADTPPDSRKHARHTALRQRLMTQKAHAQKRRKTAAQPTGAQRITKEAL